MRSEHVRRNSEYKCICNKVETPAKKLAVLVGNREHVTRLHLVVYQEYDEGGTAGTVKSYAKEERCNERRRRRKKEKKRDETAREESKGKEQTTVGQPRAQETRDTSEPDCFNLLRVQQKC